MIPFTKEILNGDYTDEEIFFEFVDILMLADFEESFDTLPQYEKNILLVGCFLSEVTNGGFGQFFESSVGHYASTILTFLISANEESFSKILEKAIRIFKSKLSNSTKFNKYAEIDSNFYNLSIKEYNNLYKKCVAYIRDNNN